MKIIAVIPARYASSRLEAKPLQMLGSKTLIQRVYDAVLHTNLFSEVIIATDNKLIFEHAASFNANVKMTSDKHQSGSDRIAEVCEMIDCDIVVNVQGDEPFISKPPLQDLISAFNDPSVQVASLMHQIHDLEDIQNPNNVKVITDINSDAIYFSRSVIPYQRNIIPELAYYKHIGVYAYRKDTLLNFVKTPQSLLEKTESLEQLRLIDNAVKIKMIKTEYQAIGIDTPEDLIKARSILND